MGQKMIRFLISATIILLTADVFAVAHTSQPPLDHASNSLTQNHYQKLTQATNQARQAHDLPKLTYNAKLQHSACIKARAMLKHNNWAHKMWNGKQPWVTFTEAGYDYQRAGENLAMHFNGNTKDITTAWMNSPDHRANILGDYTEIGFCQVKGQFQGGVSSITVEHFGTEQ